MTEVDVEIVIQGALEKHPGVKPRIISDNGSQYISKDFKAFVRFGWNDARENEPLLPAEQWKAGTFLRHTEKGVDSSEPTSRLRRGSQADLRLREALQ